MNEVPAILALLPNPHRPSTRWGGRNTSAPNETFFRSIRPDAVINEFWARRNPYISRRHTGRGT